MTRRRKLLVDSSTVEHKEQSKPYLEAIEDHYVCVGSCGSVFDEWDLVFEPAEVAECPTCAGGLIKIKLWSCKVCGAGVLEEHWGEHLTKHAR